MCLTKYILACDERGTIYRNSKSQSWVYGGFIFRLKEKDILVNRWNSIKYSLCGSSDVEMKWSNFFYKTDESPLQKELDLEGSLIWALDQIFTTEIKIVPVNMRAVKSELSEECFRTTLKGNQAIDYEILSVAIYGQFALFLNIFPGIGEMWFDQLGSDTEQDRKQKAWIELRNNNSNKNNKRMLKRILPTIKFLDSSIEPIIQIADFISGVIWAASEGDEKYLIHKFESYFGQNWSKICLVTIT